MALLVKYPLARAGDIEVQVQSLGWEDPQEEGMQPTAVLLPGESHEQRSLAGYSPWGHKESDTTEVTTRTHTHILFYIVSVSICIPTNSALGQEGSISSTHSPAFIACRSFDNGLSDQCNVIRTVF